MLLEFAARNSIEIKYKTLEEVIAAQDYGPSGEVSLNNFLDYLTECKRVLCTYQDFNELSYAFIKRCREDNTRYVEIMFDPQSHLERGIEFETFFSGIKQGCDQGTQDFGIEYKFIMCLLRDKSVEEALSVMDMALPYRKDIVGLGLDNYELDDFPHKFKSVFERGRAEGYRLTSHCDCDLAKSRDHIRDCVEVLGVERIDHGINCLDEPELLALIKNQQIALTICPTWRISDPGPRRIDRTKQLLDEGVLASINTDDPSLFASGYLNNMLIELWQGGSFSLQEIVHLTKNAFLSSWLNEEQKTGYIASLKNHAHKYDVEFSWP